MQIVITTQMLALQEIDGERHFLMGQSLRYRQYSPPRITDMPPPKTFVYLMTVL